MLRSFCFGRKKACTFAVFLNHNPKFKALNPRSETQHLKAQLASLIWLCVFGRQRLGGHGLRVQDLKGVKSLGEMFMIQGVVSLHIRQRIYDSGIVSVHTH